MRLSDSTEGLPGSEHKALPGERVGGYHGAERAQALAERPTEASRKSKLERAGEVAKLEFSLLRASVMEGDLRCSGS